MNGVRVLFADDTMAEYPKGTDWFFNAYNAMVSVQNTKVVKVEVVVVNKKGKVISRKSKTREENVTLASYAIRLVLGIEKMED